MLTVEDNLLSVLLFIFDMSVTFAMSRSDRFKRRSMHTRSKAIGGTPSLVVIINNGVSFMQDSMETMELRQRDR